MQTKGGNGTCQVGGREGGRVWVRDRKGRAVKLSAGGGGGGGGYRYIVKIYRNLKGK